jgi:hypothetical protein
VVVALGEPGEPVTCCAAVGEEDISPSIAKNAAIPRVRFSVQVMNSLLFLTCRKYVGAIPEREARDATFRRTDAALEERER